MKGEKTRIMLIYVLLVVIIGLVVGLIFVVFNSNKPKVEKPKEDNGPFNITKKCTFEMTNDEYIGILGSQTNDLCDGNNLIVINDIILDDVKQNINIVYNNSSISQDDEQTGVYVDDMLLVNHAATNYVNRLSVFDNKLFIISNSENYVNVTVYNSDASQIYDLEKALVKANISDQALTEMAKTNPSINPIVSPANLDANDFMINDMEFTFSTNGDPKCTNGSYNGSIYKVTFNGELFADPVYVSSHVCGITG